MNKNINLRTFLLILIICANPILHAGFLNDFLQENKEYCIGGVVLTTIAGIAGYHYYKKNNNPIHKDTPRSNSYSIFSRYTRPVDTYKSMVASSIGSFLNFASYVNRVNYATKFKIASVGQDIQSGIPSKSSFDKVLPQVQEFLTNCTPPDNVLDVLLQEQNSLNSEELEKFNYNPEYYNDFARAQNKPFILETGNAFTSMLGARRMQNFVAQQQYATIDIPKKYLILSNTDKKNWIMVTDKAPATPATRTPHTIDLAQMKEMVDFVDQTGFWAFGQCYVDNGKIFFGGSELWSNYKWVFSVGKRTREHNVEKLQRYLLSEHATGKYVMTDNAALYLQQKVIELKELSSSREKYSIPYRKDLDDNPTLDNGAMYQFLRVYNASKQNQEYLYWDKHEYEWDLV